jgi:hypothetical protein
VTNEFTSKETKECPYCAETIKKAAKICRFCKTDLSTGEPVSQTQTGIVGKDEVKEVKASSSVEDGVKLGCGMFIVLPLIIIGILILVVAGGSCSLM